jgi:hypothetical protein
MVTVVVRVLYMMFQDMEPEVAMLQDVVAAIIIMDEQAST